MNEKAKKKADEDRKHLIAQKIQQEKDRSPAGVKVNEKTLKEKFEKELYTDKEKSLAELRVRLTPSIYD